MILYCDAINNTNYNILHRNKKSHSLDINCVKQYNAVVHKIRDLHLLGMCKNCVCINCLE